MRDYTTGQLVEELIRRIEAHNNSNGVTDFRLRMIEWLRRLWRVAEQEGY